MGEVTEGEVQVLINKEVPFVSRPATGQTEKYRLLRILDEGGMGFICTAERRRDGRKVALKIPKPLGFPFFDNETEVYRDLSEPKCDNVLQCWDEVECSHPFIQVNGLVLELCHISVLDFWRTPWIKRITANITTMVLGQIWNGIAHLHSKGYEHGDFSMDNIIIDANSGTVKLCDFGITTKENELALKKGILDSARKLSHLVTNMQDEQKWMEKCASALLSNDSLCRQFPEDVQAILPYVFQVDLHRRYTEQMQEKKTWWDERVSQAPHLQEIATKAIQWMHTTSTGTEGVVCSNDAATTFVRSLGFRGYDAINAAGIASDLRRISTPAMKAECSVYFEDFLKNFTPKAI